MCVCVWAWYNIGQSPSGALAAQYGVVVCVSAHGVVLINRKYVMFISNICFYDPFVTSDLSVLVTVGAFCLVWRSFYLNHPIHSLKPLKQLHEAWTRTKSTSTTASFCFEVQVLKPDVHFNWNRWSMRHSSYTFTEEMRAAAVTVSGYNMIKIYKRCWFCWLCKQLHKFCILQ